MQRARRLMSFWQYLPAFRVVAETEHVRRAAEMLRVSPSALSRTIGLLEDDVGQPLFERRGRRLRLTREGATLAGAVRQAMRLVDEGLASATSRTHAGPLRVHAPPALAALVAAALGPLREEHPDLVPVVTCRIDGPLGALLVRGDLDLALVFRPDAAEGVEVFDVSTVTWSACCGAGHPLASARRLTARRVLEEPVALLSPMQAGGGPSWPDAGGLKVAFETDDLAALVGSCERGEAVALLPDIVIEQHERLAKLSQPRVEPLELRAARRSRLVPEDLVDRAMSVIRERLG